MDLTTVDEVGFKELITLDLSRVVGLVFAATKAEAGGLRASTQADSCFGARRISRLVITVGLSELGADATGGETAEVTAIVFSTLTTRWTLLAGGETKGGEAAVIVGACDDHV